MEQVYAQALNLIDTLAQKQSIKGLNEFEYKLYEKLCNAMAVYFGGLAYRFQISAMDCEKDCAAAEVQYLKWLHELEQAKIEAEKQERRDEQKDPPPESPTEV